MTARDDIGAVAGGVLRERYLSFRLHHAALGTFASPEDFADMFVEWSAAVLAEALAPMVAEVRAGAWDKGWDQGTGDAWQNGGHESTPNPYRAEAVAEQGGGSK